ncbi:hypothetical protein COOONC_11248 [Cooperia oncophora]
MLGQDLEAGQLGQFHDRPIDDVGISDEDLEADQLDRRHVLPGNDVKSLVEGLDLIVFPIGHHLAHQGEVTYAEGEVDPSPKQAGHRHSAERHASHGSERRQEVNDSSPRKDIASPV